MEKPQDNVRHIEAYKQALVELSEVRKIYPEMTFEKLVRANEKILAGLSEAEKTEYLAYLKEDLEAH
ncbi:MAG: hypothetical protein R3B45_14525 [Bdellovibrionota bacterium]